MKRWMAGLGLMMILGGARAQDGIWTFGTNGIWGDPANWAGGTVASGFTSTAYFIIPTNNLTVSQNDPALVIGNIVFTNANYTISNQLITLDNGANPPVITAGGSTRSITISAPLASANGLLVNGDGTLNLTGVNTGLAGTIVVSATAVANNNNAGLVLLPGAVGAATGIVVNTNAFLSISGGVTLGTNVTTVLSGSGGMLAPLGTLRGIGAATVTNVVNGPVVLTGTGTSVRISNSGASQLTINGPITTTVTNQTVVFRFNDNNGVFITNTNNAWAGLTQVSQGGLRSTPGAVPSNSTVQIGASGDAYWETFGSIVRAPGTAVNSHLIDLSQGGNTGRVIGLSARGGPLTVNLGGAGATLKWGQSGFNPAVLQLNSPRADDTLTLVNGLDFSGAMRTIRVDAVTATLSGRLTNSATTNVAALVKAGAGRMVLGGSNTFDGPLTILAGTLALDGDAALGRSTGAASTNVLFAAAATLQANAASVTTAPSRQISFATNLTVTFDSATNALVIESTVAGGTLAKTGAGTLALRGTNYLFGSFNANDGLTLIEGITKSCYPSNAGSPNAIQLGNVGGFTAVVTIAAGGVLGTTNASLKVGNAVNSSALLRVLPGATAITEVTPAFLSTNDVGNQSHVLIGAAAGSVAVVEQSGGLVFVGNQFFLGQNAGSFGAYQLSAGSLIVTGQSNPYLTAPIARFRIGSGSTGVFYQTGGSVTVNVDRISMGYNSSFGRGVLYIAGGNMTAPVNGLNSVNRQGTRAEITVAGSGLFSLGGTVSLGETNIGENAILNLNGGTLRAANLFSPANAGLVNFNGGLFVAATGTTTFLQGLLAAQVRPGGAFIDTTNFSLTAGTPLIAPPGQGIASIAVTGATNFLGSPYVQITGGGGSNATAVAEIDSLGNVTNIVVTSSGENYTSAPTVVLRGGGGTPGAAVATLAANGSGGLTKLGTGVLILSNANTYVGATVVSNGTLQLRGSGTIAASTSIVVAAGATLAVTGRVDGALNLVPGQTLLGEGAVAGHVNNDGVVQPGRGPGLLNVSGNYTQTSGVLRVEIGGLAPGTGYDLLNVTLDATIGGTLDVSLVNGFVPNVGDGFLVLSAMSSSGSFAATNLPALPAGRAWDVLTSSGAVLLSVVASAGPTGYDAFALQITNTATRGIQDDADGDGYANLLEYVTGANPTNADTLARLQGTRTNGVLALRFTRDTNSVDATLVVEAANSAVDNAPWLGIATNVGGVWAGAPVTESAGNPASVVVQDTDPAATNRFLRLRVSRP